MTLSSMRNRIAFSGISFLHFMSLIDQSTMSGAIPRFLLPQQGPIWRSRAVSISRTTQIIRNASHKATPKAKTTPITSKVPVLEKPAKFNPPSHGSKLSKARPQYQGPPLSEAQKVAQRTRRYPHTMPNEGTFLHWFLNNRSIHTYITLVLSPVFCFL